MKYRGFNSSILMIICLILLTGCTAREKNITRKISDIYSQADGFEATVKMKVDLASDVAKFTLAWVTDENGSHIEVIEPSDIAGIKVMISPQMQTINCDNVILTLPRTDGTQSAMPLEILYDIYMQWTSGIYTDTYTQTIGESKYIVISYEYLSSEKTVDLSTWFDASTYTPVKAEVMYDGQRQIECEFCAFAINNTEG